MFEELSVGLALHRYDALARLRDAHDGAAWFGTRMMGRPALVVRGEEGVRTFYDPELVTRKGAVPAPVRLTLFGPGAVHGLNGDVHARRKHLLMRMIDTESTARLTDLVARRLDDAAARWVSEGTVPLFDSLVDVYGPAVLEWSGSGTSGEEATGISRELARIVDGFGLGGTAYPRAVLARTKAQTWAIGVIRDARAGRLHPAEHTPLAILAAAPRRELPDLVAATELLNVVRPTVAVAYFGAYAAHALDRRPDWREALASGSREHLRAFEHEIRRWYPFVPLLTGRLQQDYEWQGHTFGRGSWMVLDVIGTNRDPGLWDDPDEFLPERFLGREPTPYDYVPHGGGHPSAGHRCPGEPLAVGILEATLHRLAQLDFELTEAAEEVPHRRIPSLPKDHLTLVGVRTARAG